MIVMSESIQALAPALAAAQAEMGSAHLDAKNPHFRSKYASLDDKLDGLHYYMARVKFGIGRCTSDAAHEIRDGDLSREEGLALVARYDGEFPERHLPYT